MAAPQDESLQPDTTLQDSTLQTEPSCTDASEKKQKEKKSQQQQKSEKQRVRSRMSSLDIRTIVGHLRRHAIGLFSAVLKFGFSFGSGMRLGNVYDINQSTYTLKLGKAADKSVILIEVGIRVHETKFTRTKPINPSPFSLKVTVKIFSS